MGQDSYLPLIPYKWRHSLLQSPFRTCTVRNGGYYSLSQYDMNSLLAANVKCGDFEVKKMIMSMYHMISLYIDMMMLIIMLL